MCPSLTLPLTPTCSSQPPLPSQRVIMPPSSRNETTQQDQSPGASSKALVSRERTHANVAETVPGGGRRRACVVCGIRLYYSECVSRPSVSLLSPPSPPLDNDDPAAPPPPRDHDDHLHPSHSRRRCDQLLGIAETRSTLPTTPHPPPPHDRRLTCARRRHRPALPRPPTKPQPSRFLAARRPSPPPLPELPLLLWPRSSRRALNPLNFDIDWHPSARA